MTTPCRQGRAVKAHTRRADAPWTAILVKRRHVDVDDVSRQGCSLKGPEPLDVGRIGLLTVTIGGQTLVELFRVARIVSAPDADSLYEAGVEFLPFPGGAPSLHDLAAQLDEFHSS